MNQELFKCLDCSKEYLWNDIKDLDYCPNCENIWLKGESNRYGKLLGIKKKCNNWDKDGKGAGFIRNRKIVEDCEILIAFTTGSKGTQNSIDLATKLGKKVIIHKVESDNTKPFFNENTKCFQENPMEL